MCSVYKIIVFLVFLFGFSYAQNQFVEFDIYDDLSLMSKNSTNNARKHYRQFKRLIASSSLTDLQVQNINHVLSQFKSRKMRFNDGYVPFFQLVINFSDQDLPPKFLSHCLQFLSFSKEMYTNLDFKIFLNRTNLFLSKDILHQSSYLTWSYDGDFHFTFKDDKHPVFFISNSNIFLSNLKNKNTLNDVNGYFDILSNTFIANSAKVKFDNNHLSIDFNLEHFEINLNKKFFSADSVYMSSAKSFYGHCYGSYKNQLAAENKAHSFVSYDQNNLFEVFEGMNFSSGVSLKGDVIYFTSFYNNPASFFFEDDNSSYNFFASSFKLEEERVEASNVEFLIKNNFGSLSHPHVDMVYNDQLKKLLIERGDGLRGLNPIRNKFHGLNIYADKLDFDLTSDNCLFFHKSIGRDLKVLTESDHYFDISRYRDFVANDVNILSVLLDFVKNKDVNNYYDLIDFSAFANLDLEAAMSHILNLEIFGIVDFRIFTNTFKVNSWALNFDDAGLKDYDYLKFESLSTVSDTIANLDLINNEMDLYLLDKVSITSRFDFQLDIEQNKIKFFDDKSFYMDGNIKIGNFIFSGKNIAFDYHNFNFDFDINSVLSFIDNRTFQLSSSFIYFDDAQLFVDSCNNKSGLDKLNSFPRFQVLDKSYFAYTDKASSFIVDPFELKYIYDISLSNLSFPGNMYISSDTINFRSVLSFDDNLNLATQINSIDSAYIFDNRLLFSGDLYLNKSGLTANGFFKSDELIFQTDKIEINSNQIFGNVNYIRNGESLDSISFSTNDILLSYFPNQKKFLVKSPINTINLYSNMRLKGDIYFDGHNMNGSGKLFNSNYLFNSSHHFFSNNSVMSADTYCQFFNLDSTIILETSSVSIENNLNTDSIFIFSSISNFEMPSIQHTLYFDLLIIDMFQKSMSFSNNNPYKEGSLIAHHYRKKGLIYNSLEASYDWNDNQFCVQSVFPIKAKKFLIQPDNNSFCFSSDGELPTFKNATIIKNRKLFKDKLINHVDATINSSLKLTWIKD